jgi:hypothetical protein
MGFRPEPTKYNLTFDGTPYEGLNVKATCCTVGEYRRMLQVAAADRTGGITEEGLKGNDWILQLFADNLVSWDLEDPATGLPVSPNLDGINSQEQRLITILLTAWQIALTTVPTSLPNVSPSGETSEEQSLGLGSASSSLPS